MISPKNITAETNEPLLINSNRGSRQLIEVKK